MVRTQIQLTEQQAARLRRLSSERRRSMAALVRDAVEDLLAAEDDGVRWGRALSAVGSAGQDEATDVSLRHDDYLADTYS